MKKDICQKYTNYKSVTNLQILIHAFAQFNIINPPKSYL